MAHLLYGFEQGGFVLLTGEVGTGKTTLLRDLISRTPPDIEVAFILNPRLTVRDLLLTLCEELGMTVNPPPEARSKYFIDLLNARLLETYKQGKSTVVIIDEAQNLSPSVLEQIRLLTNLETNERKLLRIILVGQPELDELLDRKDLRQLSQRITARFHLTPLKKSELAAYLQRRLLQAGCQRQLFSEHAIRTFFQVTKRNSKVNQYHRRPRVTWRLRNQLPHGDCENRQTVCCRSTSLDNQNAAY